jgi:hypothetical protein
MNMHVIMAVLSLTMLVWAGPASAQATHTASVSVHRDLRQLTQKEVRKILADASHALKTNPAFACPVTFKLKGPVGRFGSKKQPKVILTEAQRDAVHAVDAEKDATFQIKVVEAIGFCTAEASYNGCAWPANLPSIIVVHPDKHKDNDGQPVTGYPDHLLWPHEFGHLTGLSHRDAADLDSLMTGCPLTTASVKVTEYECGCLLSGPEGCGNPKRKSCPQ